MRRHLITYGLLIAVGAVCFMCISVYILRNCTSVQPEAPVMSSHGFNVWFSSTLASFEHAGEKICIPYGWKAIGATKEKFGWALYPLGASGVLIHASDFETELIRTENNSYELSIIYPKSLASELAKRYVATIEDAFNHVGALYPNTKGQLRTHTVLITVGVAGDGTTFETSVYPNPSSEMSMFVRNIDHVRAEELFIHAVAHLHNRYRTDLILYQDSQWPLLAEDWQELEAAWIEVIYRTSDEGRVRRLRDLYDIHTAIYTHAFSESLIYPFNNREIFDAVSQYDVSIQPNSVYSDYQYGHYVVAPLVMVAIEGLLQQYNAQTNVATILTEVHRGAGTNFFEKLAVVLPPEEMVRIMRWVNGEEIIPQELILPAVRYYEKVQYQQR